MSKFDNHISMKMGSNVQEICTPLFSGTDICYFHYGRVYKDGSAIALANNVEWSKHCFNKKYHLNNINTMNNPIHLYNFTNLNPKILIDLRNNFGLEKMLHLNNYYKDFWEIIGFATSQGNNKIIEFYYNKIDLLKLFSVYFQEKAAKLIKLLERKENRMILPGLANLNRPLSEKYDLRNKLVDQLQKIGYPVNTPYGQIHLSSREIECLIYLLRGRTAVETAKALGISSKTVEYYIDLVKLKLDCHTRAELFDMAWSTGIIHLIIQS